MNLYLGRFASTETYPDQELIRLPNGEFYWSLNDTVIFEMFFDTDGVFTHSVQEDIDGDLMTFTKPNGQIPEPLTPEIMAQAKGV